MDAIEKAFQDEIEERLGSANFKVFKRDRLEIYEAGIKTVRRGIAQTIKADYLTLIKDKITKIRVTEKRKNFLFGGCYMLKGCKVVLLESIETIGTFYCEDAKLFRMLENHKIGHRVGLVLEGGKIEIIVPHETYGGLFG